MNKELEKIIKEAKKSISGKKREITEPKLEPYMYFTQIPKRFRDKTLDNFEFPESEKEKLKNAILSGASFLITGPVGSGKTHLAVALGLEYWKKKADEKNLTNVVRFVSCSDFFLELKAYIGAGVSEYDFIRRYLVSDLIIFDDLGTEKVSDWSKQVFYTLFNRIYLDMKQVIITSNLSPKEIGDWYDTRIPSRIMEMGEVVRVRRIDARMRK